MQTTLFKQPEDKKPNFVEKSRRQIAAFIIVVNADGYVEVK